MLADLPAVAVFHRHDSSALIAGLATGRASVVHHEMAAGAFRISPRQYPPLRRDPGWFRSKSSCRRR